MTNLFNAFQLTRLFIHFTHITARIFLHVLLFHYHIMYIYFMLTGFYYCSNWHCIFFNDSIHKWHVLRHLFQFMVCNRFNYYALTMSILSSL